MPVYGDTISTVVTPAQALELCELLYSLGWEHGTQRGAKCARSSFDEYFTRHETLRGYVNLYPKVRHFDGGSGSMSATHSPAQLIQLLTPNAE
jgi:hypothetical protein